MAIYSMVAGENMHRDGNKRWKVRCEECGGEECAVRVKSEKYGGRSEV